MRREVEAGDDTDIEVAIGKGKREREGSTSIEVLCFLRQRVSDQIFNTY